MLLLFFSLKENKIFIHGSIAMSSGQCWEGCHADFFFFFKILLGKILEGPAGEANHRKINKDTLSLPNS